MYLKGHEDSGGGKLTVPMKASHILYVGVQHYVPDTQAGVMLLKTYQTVAEVERLYNFKLYIMHEAFKKKGINERRFCTKIFWLEFII
jgi:sulfur relay (sulfurtransferase) DsrF/TusC family protein